MKTLEEVYGANFVDAVNGAITCKRKGGELSTPVFETLVKIEDSIFDYLADPFDGRPIMPVAIGTPDGWIKFYARDDSPFSHTECTVDIKADAVCVRVRCCHTMVEQDLYLNKKVPLVHMLEIVALMFECFRCVPDGNPLKLSPNYDKNLRPVTEEFMARVRVPYHYDVDLTPLSFKLVYDYWDGLSIFEVEVHE